MFKKFLLIFFLCTVVEIAPLHAITLNEAIEIALKNNPEFLIQKQKLLEAKEEKRAKKAINYGKIIALGSYTRYNIPRTLAPIVPPISPDVITSKDITSAGIVYDVLLFNGFADITAVKIADLSENTSKIKLNITKEQLVFNVKSLYFKILAMESQKEAALTYYKALKILYDNVAKEVALGKKAKIDLLKVAADLENASFNMENIKNSIDSLKAMLAALIGVDEIEDVAPVNDDEKINNFIDVKDTYKYKLSEIEVRKSKKALKKSKSLYYPKIGFSAYYGNNYAKGEKEELWQAGITVNWLLFDFGSRKSQLQKAKISHMNAILQLKKTELELKSFIIDAQNKIATAVEKVKSVKRQLEFLSKVKEAEKIKYEKGASNMYDLLFAYAKYQDAKSNYIDALYNLRIQKAYLNYLLAGEK
ncbi:TolC family protein [Deferribacter abyssi]|uniref:TolC family protein n=1 Tax=Deferribacter abyssi TaxID=213806 RepID=UPI003C181180